MVNGTGKSIFLGNNHNEPTSLSLTNPPPYLEDSEGKSICLLFFITPEHNSESPLFYRFSKYLLKVIGFLKTKHQELAFIELLGTCLLCKSFT